jgi:hypothetical protein
MKSASKPILFFACFAILIGGAFLAYKMDLGKCFARKSWSEFAPEGQAFSVEFPGQPEVVETRRELNATDVLEKQSYRLKVRSETYAIVTGTLVSSTGEVHDFDAEEGFEGFRQGLIQQYKDTQLLSEMNITSKDGTSGREYVITAPDEGVIATRIFYKRNLMFALSIATAEEEDMEQDRQRIFDSFTITLK